MTTAQITALNSLDPRRMGRAVQEFIEMEPAHRAELLRAVRQHAPAAWEAWLGQAWAA